MRDEDDGSACGGVEWASRMAAGAVAPRDDSPEGRRRAAERARNVESYHRRRAILIAAMGGVCATPGCGVAERLEFNHLKPRTWVARKLNRWARLARYIREHAAGDLDLRCRSCNARAGRPKRLERKR